MTLKQFIEENNVTGFEKIGGLLFNVIVDGSTPYGLDVDTSSIISNTLLEKIDTYSIDNDILTIGDITININEINLLE